MGAGISIRRGLPRRSRAFVRARDPDPLGHVLPIHLRLKGKPRFVDMPPLEFEAALNDAAPDVELRVLRPGEGFEL